MCGEDDLFVRDGGELPHKCTKQFVITDTIVLCGGGGEEGEVLILCGGIRVSVLKRKIGVGETGVCICIVICCTAGVGVVFVDIRSNLFFL